jgi:nucleoside-diphosphate-sugar epimerase
VGDGHGDWTGRRVLVTGGTGFIGSCLVDRLASLGAETHLAVRSPVPAERAHLVDLGDPDDCLALVAAIEPQVVLHLASMVSGARGVELVVPMMRANQGFAVNLLAAVAQTAPAARVVLAGSIEENLGGDGSAPTSPYTAAKLAATSYATMFARLWELPVSVLRIAMVYGPGQADRSKLVPSVTTALLRGEDPPVGSGRRLVDWVFVEDVVDAFLCAAGTATPPGAVVDVCSGEPVTIRETLDRLAGIVGGSGAPRFGAIPDRVADVAQIGDPRAAAELIGWRPTTSLDDGLRRTVRWYAEHPT